MGICAFSSHELRTPHTSIKGYVDLVLHGEAGPAPADQREFLGIARVNVERLVAMVNELLDLSRIEAGKVALRLGEGDLAALITRVARALRPPLADKRQTLHLELENGLPPVCTDANRVEQILTNLLSNAHKYTLAGGTITLRAARDDLALRVDVQDTGVGMTPEDLARHFQKFFRAQHRATQDVGGTGLGLAITRSLVELHGGTLRVTSVLDRGSAFSFTIPLAEAESPP